MPISTPAVRRLFWLALVALAGCGSGTDSRDSARQADAPAVLCPYGDAGNASAVILVSPDGSDSDSCGGSAETACATISAAIARCSVADCAVAVRHGLYPITQTIVLRDAVSVHGSCRFGDEPDHHYRTVIEAAPPAGMPAIDANAINSSTIISGLLVLGKDETAPGEASVGMRVSASKGLTLAAVTLASGTGGDGAAGKGANGGTGGNGEAPRFASTADNAPGGLACPGEPSQATGRGGLGTESFDFTAAPSSCGFACNCYPVEPKKKDPALASLFMGQGSGGARGGMYGENGNSGPSCNPYGVPPPTAGQPGNNGELGDCGQAGGKRNEEEQPAGPPRLVDGRWLASFGAMGERGGNGSGGGGGGSGGYAYYNAEKEIYYRGLPGGGGGGGGCGGAGGSGGQQGGASIALILVDTTISGLANAVLIPGKGGHGGGGGNGGGGGPGGLGGAAPFPQQPWPVLGAFKVPGLGAKGGDGGAGGAGAGGAGGNGGPTPAVALAGNSPAPDLTAGIVYSGTPGMPGARGIGATNPAKTNNPNSQCRASDGEDGVAGSASSTLRIEGTN
ncbi:hypothetical protein [Noviherbaspirillum soli]|uniref:hypothetical protein n=1 Tax=Noviherbaspirillum soli TaxID=1064518 RepID=UPI00188A33F6|nr:hypothetical protein [Noviherbaspirillum soli]